MDSIPGALIQNDHAIEIQWSVRIQIFSDAVEKSKQLRANNGRTQRGDFRTGKSQFAYQIAVFANGFGRVIANGDDRSAELFHFGQHFAFRARAGFTQKKRQACFWTDHCLRSVAKFHGVKKLAVRARHLHHLESAFASQSVERTLAEENKVVEIIRVHKCADFAEQFADARFEMFGHIFHSLHKPAIPGFSDGQELQRQQHGAERFGHHQTYFVGAGDSQ
ncbi:MAG TPA: hypothetical protein VK769_01180, partial [Verrucomicrobiae bacterium]|nr:hypothetical protein [Verrucomicrobiae bacterium]